MITGIVNSKLEAMTGLTVIAPTQVSRHIDALIDTGYSGQLSLPPATVAALQLSFRGRSQGILADGSIQYFDVYDASIMWDGQLRAVEVDDSMRSWWAWLCLRGMFYKSKSSVAET